MSRAMFHGQWMMIPNQRTGRTEIYEERGDSEILVASIGGHNPSLAEILEIQRRLTVEESNG